MCREIENEVVRLGWFAVVLALTGCGSDGSSSTDASSSGPGATVDGSADGGDGAASAAIDSGEPRSDAGGLLARGDAGLDAGLAPVPTLAITTDDAETPLAFTNVVCTLPVGPFSGPPELTVRLDRFDTSDGVAGSIETSITLDGSGSAFTGTALVDGLYYGDNLYRQAGMPALALDYSISGVPDLRVPPYDEEFTLDGQLSLAQSVTLTPLIDVGDPALVLPAQDLSFSCRVKRIAPMEPDASVMDPMNDPLQPVLLACDWDLTGPERCPVCENTVVCDPPSYTDNGDGTVTSTCCALVWQKQVEDARLSWDQAAAYCAGLELAGGGWRLPSVAELESLVVLGQSPQEPTIDRVAFPDTPVGFYWSSSAAKTPNWVWAMHFYAGLPITFGSTTAGQVRCVR